MFRLVSVSVLNGMICRGLSLSGGHLKLACFENLSQAVHIKRRKLGGCFHLGHISLPKNCVSGSTFVG